MPKLKFIKKKAVTSISSPRILSVGVDPGASGGIAYQLPGEQWTLLQMPENEIQLLEITEELNLAIERINISETIVFIENVHAMPQQGVVSMFKFGMNFGMVRQAFASFTREFIQPLAWQRAMKVEKRGKAESKPEYKNRILKRAINLVPRHEAWKRNLGYQRSVCDALLIAEYGRLKMLGRLK